MTVSFGQQSGPPASSKQIAFLLSLFEQQGYNFSTGRHHFGLTQRQSNGKFTIGEASELIERLENMEEPSPGMPAIDPPVVRQARQKLDAERSTVLRGIPAEQLADELERRGWVVIPPA
jgi:hypothetical protein